MRLETFCSKNSWMVMWDCRIYFMKEVQITINERKSSDEIRDILFRK
jgi:hypothetical protein